MHAASSCVSAPFVADEPRPRPATFTDVVVLLLEPQALACADRAVPMLVESRRRLMTPATADKRDLPFAKAYTVTPPKRLNDIRPTYTEEARSRRLEGDVLIAATLTPDGCFAQGIVAKSPSPMLSGSALFATLEWKYSPGLIDGKPTSSVMMVTVHFALP